MSDQNIVLILGFIGMIICVITPIIKLNTSITRLNVTLENFQKQTEDNHRSLNNRVTEHGNEIDELVERVIKLETRR